MDEQLIGFAITGALSGCAGALVHMAGATLVMRGTMNPAGYQENITAYLNTIPVSPLSHQLEKIKTDILAIFDNFMSHKLTDQMPVLKMFIDEQLISEIRVIFHNEMELHLPQLFEENLSSEKTAGMIFQMMDTSIARAKKSLQKNALRSTIIATAVGILIGITASFLF